MKTYFPESEKLTDVVTKMIKLGFRRQVIRMSLNVSDSLIKNIKRDNNFPPEDKTGRMKTSETILSDSASRLEATIFIILYFSVAEDPENVLDVMDVVMSFEIYRELRPRFAQSVENRMLDASDAWVIVRDYLNRNIMLYDCADCGKNFLSPCGYPEDSGQYFCPHCTGNSDMT